MNQEQATPPEPSRRKAGVLLHLSSLPGPGPVGNMGEEARRFVNFLQASGQGIWQVLPLTPPAVSDSPYSAYSVFAGNPCFIDLTPLEEEKLIPAGSVAALSRGKPGQADYRAWEREVLPLLRQAFQRDYPQKQAEIGRFRQAHSFWLEDYALYMSIRTQQGDISYHDWPPLLCIREERQMKRTRYQQEQNIQFWIYLQYLFFTQWAALRAYANSRGVEILGDMPIYTASGSADVWAHSQVFQVDSLHRPSQVAGVPPDAFSADGQLWGNPLYDWDYLQKTGYQWWIERLRVARLLYDQVRIDHFRALDEYYAIPAESDSAIAGEWCKGPGMDFFRAVKAALPDLQLVAEDLGILTDSVRALLRDSGLPGMRVMLFGMQPDGKSEYLPEHHIPHCVAYIGTHDNDTAQGWLKEGPADEVAFARSHLRLSAEEGEHWGFIRSLYTSPANTAVVQMQDFLGLDNAARMNVPATVGGNWVWRLDENALTASLAEKIHNLTKAHGRVAQ